MKLICHTALILWFSITCNCQKIPQEQYPFPPHFKPPNSGVIGSDSSIYLPPESHTTMPYFSVNNANKIPFQFLPATVTKIPSIYPTPFSMISISSTMGSRRNEEEDDNDEEISSPRMSHVTPHKLRLYINETIKNVESISEKEMRAVPKTFNNYQNPVDRIDIKFPTQFHTVTPRNIVNQSPSPQRRMIISREILKNDQPTDQVKRAAILGPQFISSPVVYYSTTEPAIPILRLSNEMDLDGSFSYEALGADQTHYVQHSRMENSGTDKEEQVVEGSYSYVGDNGQTYTVHYVADSNGYRASGDHLPVAPPIPEIIQRAIQYNLAEEAKKPLHLKSWQESEKEYEQTENGKHRYPISPPRNLFTGRTPEAFSFAITQSSLLQNNIPAADNSQVPVKPNFDLSAEQSKSKVSNNPIAPQITFLASQGAHNPATNSGQQQISRVFATEKPTLPQLMNYEASNLESDEDNNKALWRWQYGINANAANNNLHSNKNSISRSFGEGDDVIINFNNMSPEQYTQLTQSNFMEHNTETSISQSQSKNKESAFAHAESAKFVSDSRSENKFLSTINRNDILKFQDDEIDKLRNNISAANVPEINLSTDTIISNNYSTPNTSIEKVQYPLKNKVSYTNYSSYITPTTLTTQSFMNMDAPYESTKLLAQNIFITTQSTDPSNNNKNNDDKLSRNNYDSNTGKSWSDINISTDNAILSHVNKIKFSDFIQREQKNNFKPIMNVNLEKVNVPDSTTTEASPESMLRENFFLKKIFRANEGQENANVDRNSENFEELQTPVYSKINLEPKFDKSPKYIQYHPKPENELKNVIKKPLDITDVLNYLTLKNHFESSKLKTKNKFSNSDKFSSKLERPQIFIPLENDREVEMEQLEQVESHNNLRTLNNQKQQELRGIIKNYKVLQRNTNAKNMRQSMDQFMTDASQRHLKTMQTQNLPPLGRAGPSMKIYSPPTYI